MSKNIKILVTLMIISLLFLSCDKGKKIEKHSEVQVSSYVLERLDIVSEAMATVKLEKGEVWQMDVPEKSASYYTADPFYAASFMKTMDTWFNFKEYMTAEQIADLTKAFCVNLPLDPEFEDMRAVVVGDVFGEGNDLVIMLNRVTLNEGHIPGQDTGIMYLTNCKPQKIPSKETGKPLLVSSGPYINPSANVYYVALHYADGKMVFSENVNAGKYNYSKEADSLTKVNLMDTFCKDEILENDSLIEQMYNEILIESVNDPVVGVLANLNYGLYLFKKGDIQEAQSVWNSIEADVLPESTAQALKPILENDIPFYLLTSNAVK